MCVSAGRVFRYLTAVNPVHVQESPGADGSLPLTVYTIRLTTGFSRGGALSDPHSAVNVCLVGKDGRAALHRISPVNDPLDSREHAFDMCQVWSGPRQSRFALLTRTCRGESGNMLDESLVAGFPVRRPLSRVFGSLPRPHPGCPLPPAKQTPRRRACTCTLRPWEHPLAVLLPKRSQPPTTPACPSQLIDRDSTVGADCSGVLAEASAPQAPEPGGAGGAARSASSSAASSSSRSAASQRSSGPASTVGRAPPPPPPKRRFQEGSVDEVGGAGWMGGAGCCQAGWVG